MIKIKTEKIMLNCERFRKIIEITGLKDAEKFGSDYEKSDPCIDKKDNNHLVVYNTSDNSDWNQLYKNQILRETKFQEIYSSLMSAAQEAKRIKDQAKEIEKTWKDIETVII